MPPKGKAASRRNVPKAKAKAASKQAARSSDSRNVAEEPARKRTQLMRRDTDAQVDRAVGSRLSHLPKSVWASKRNASGQSVRDYIAAEIRRRRQDGGKLGSRFWAQLYEHFELQENLADSLPEPGDDQVPSAQLLDVLAAAHNENPIKATLVPLERFLDHSGPLSGTATYGLLRAIQPAPTLPRHMSVKAQVAVLRFWARTDWSNSQGSPNEGPARVLLLLLDPCSVLPPPPPQTHPKDERARAAPAVLGHHEASLR